MKSIDEIFRKPGVVLGTWVSLTDPTVIELAKMAGFDFVRVDNEYIPFDYDMMAQFIRTANNIGMPIIIRVSRLEDITMLISAGADGIMIPDGSYERAKAAIEYLKYAPLGNRSINSGSRAVRTSGLEFQEYYQQANNHVCLVVQIESQKGMDEIDMILSLDGVDFVASGRSDISQALGVPGETKHPKVDAFENRVIEKSLEHHKIPMVFIASSKMLLESNELPQEELLQKGVNVIVVDQDYQYMLNGMQAAVQKMRG